MDERVPNFTEQNNTDFSMKKLVAIGVSLSALLFLLYIFFVPAQGEDVRKVTIHEGQHREGVALAVGQALGWTAEEQSAFLFTLRSIQWDALNHNLAEYLGEQYGWSRQNRELFLVRANDILGTDQDPLAYAFVPKTYTFSSGERPAFIAEELVDEVLNAYSENLTNFFVQVVPEEARGRANEIAHTQLPKRVDSAGVKSGTSTAPDLLPDLVALPPQDLAIRHKDGQTRLVFSTTYYNIGDGPLELIGDPEKQGIEEDHDRDVLQRIYREDDTYYDKLVGTFHWHQEHLHYHYEDFIDYILAPSGVFKGGSAQASKQQKSTYCVRDISRVDAEGVESDEADYRICSKERQGVSVGWGDTYFHTYADQYFDIANLPNGSYRVTFHVNPTGRLAESDTGNNTSSAVFTIDKEAGTVEVTDHIPKQTPSFEHIHTKQDL